MTLQIDCPQCSRRLEVAPQHAGKQIRCPACQHICVAPPADSTVGPMPGDQTSAWAAAPKWHLKTPEGAIYGPIFWSDVEAWASEGRISAACELGPTENGPWRSAADLLPALPRELPRTWPASHDSAGKIAHDSQSPHPLPTTPRGSQPAESATSFLEPDRGLLILILGLLGFVVGCPVFSFMAWAMASHDLNRMRQGHMNRQGEALTLAGLILGIIVSLVWLLVGIILVVVILIALAVRF